MNMFNISTATANLRKRAVFILFYIMIFSLPIIGYAPINIYGGIKISYILGTVLLLWLSVNHFAFKKDMLYYNTLPNKFLFAWVSVSLISSVIMSLFIKKPFVTPYAAEYPVIKSLKVFVKTLLVLSVYLTTASLVKNKANLKTALRFLVYGGTFASLYGLYQIVAVRFGLPFTEIFNRNISFGGYQSIGDPTVFGRVGYMIRIGATAVEPGIFANFLLTIIPLHIIFIINNIPLLKTKLRNILTLSLMLLAFILTYSRAAWMALAFVIFLIAVYTFKTFKMSVILKRILPTALVIAVLIFTIIALTLKIDIFIDIIEYKFGFLKYIFTENLSFNKDLSGNRYPAYDGRVTVLATGINVFKKFPIFGVGWGNYGFYHYDYIPIWGNDVNTDKRFKSQKWPSCRSFYLSTLVETGIIGGGLFFTFLILIFMSARMVIKKSRDFFYKTTATGLQFSLLAILFHGITLAPFKLYSYFWFLLALILAVNRICRLGLGRLSP